MQWTTYVLIAFACILASLLTFILFKFRKLHLKKEAVMDKDDVVGRLFLKKLMKIDERVGKDDARVLSKKLNRTMRSFFSELFDIRYQFDYVELNEELSKKGVKEDIRKDIISYTMQMSQAEYGGRRMTNAELYPLLEKSSRIISGVTGCEPEAAVAEAPTEPVAAEAPAMEAPPEKTPVPEEKPPAAVAPAAEEVPKVTLPAAKAPITEATPEKPPAAVAPAAEEVPKVSLPAAKAPITEATPEKTAAAIPPSEKPASEAPAEKTPVPEEKPPAEPVAAEKPPAEAPPEEQAAPEEKAQMEAPPEKKSVPAEKKEETSGKGIAIPKGDQDSMDKLKKLLIEAEQGLRDKDYEDAMEAYTQLKGIYDSLSPEVKAGIYSETRRIIDVYNSLLREYKEAMLLGKQ